MWYLISQYKIQRIHVRFKEPGSPFITVCIDWEEEDNISVLCWDGVWNTAEGEACFKLPEEFWDSFEHGLDGTINATLSTAERRQNEQLSKNSKNQN